MHLSWRIRDSPETLHDDVFAVEARVFVMRSFWFEIWEWSVHDSNGQKPNKSIKHRFAKHIVREPKKLQMNTKLYVCKWHKGCFFIFVFLCQILCRKRTPTTSSQQKNKTAKRAVFLKSSQQFCARRESRTKLLFFEPNNVGRRLIWAEENTSAQDCINNGRFPLLVKRNKLSSLTN